MEKETKKQPARSANALFTIQQDLNAPKSQYNSFGKYSYRNCEDILEAVKPLLEKTDSTLTITDEIVVVGEGNPVVQTVTESYKNKVGEALFKDVLQPIGGARYYVKATATLRFEDKEVSVSAFAREEENKKGMDSSQITGSASSYARKYALNGLFAIDDSKDADTRDNTQSAKKESQNASEGQIEPKKNRIQERVDELRNDLKAETDAPKCPNCGNPLTLRDGKYGQFYGCSSYPRCEYKISKVKHDQGGDKEHGTYGTEGIEIAK